MFNVPPKTLFSITNRNHLFWLMMALTMAVVVTAVSLTSRTAPFNAELIPKVVNNNLLPLSFTPNRGQVPEAIHYEVRAFGGSLKFEADQVVWSGKTDTSQLTVQFIGSQAEPLINSGRRLPGTVNYLLGDNPEAWLTDIPTYESIIYQGIYPGIDLAYVGEQNVAGSLTLKGTYSVAPNADPANIQWQYQGATSLRLDKASGNLHIALPGAESQTLVEEAPVSWQVINGEHMPVASRYIISANNTVSFAFGDYNPAYPLIIDPSLVFSTYLGTNTEDAANSIAVDSQGNIFIAGWTESVNFPVTADAFQPTSTGGTCFSPPPFNIPFPCNDGFISKLSPDGSTLLYSTYLGGVRDDGVRALALDSNNNIYLTGWTTSVDFPTMNPIQPTNGSGNNLTTDSFVARLSADGSSLQYSTYIGGSGRDYGDNLAVDDMGNAYVIGWTESTNFPTVNAVQGSYGGGFFDGTITKVNTAGSAFAYSSYLGGGDLDYAFGVDVDSSGSAYITGFTLSSDFPTFNAMQPTFGGGIEAYVTKLTANGTGYVYSTYFGNNDTRGFDIRVDDNNYVYLVGGTNSATFPTVNPLQANYSGTPYDGFVSRILPDGSDLDFSTYLGGNGNDIIHTLTLGSTGNVYFTGWSSATDFPLNDAVQNTPGGNTDAIVGMISADLTTLEFSTYLGGTGNDLSFAVAIDNAGRAHIVGYTESADFPTFNPIQPDAGGERDSFVAKIDVGLPDIPQAGFISSSPDMLGETTVFTNTSVGGSLAFQWDFGDGSPVVTETNPLHAYTDAGFFTATLTATNSFGSSVFTGTVEIIDEMEPTTYYLYLPAVRRMDTN